MVYDVCAVFSSKTGLSGRGAVSVGGEDRKSVV